MARRFFICSTTVSHLRAATPSVAVLDLSCGDADSCGGRFTSELDSRAQARSIHFLFGGRAARLDGTGSGQRLSTNVTKIEALGKHASISYMRVLQGIVDRAAASPPSHGLYCHPFIVQCSMYCRGEGTAHLPLPEGNPRGIVECRRVGGLHFRLTAGA